MSFNNYVINLIVLITIQWICYVLSHFRHKEKEGCGKFQCVTQGPRLAQYNTDWLRPVYGHLLYAVPFSNVCQFSNKVTGSSLKSVQITDRNLTTDNVINTIEEVTGKVEIVTVVC